MKEVCLEEQLEIIHHIIFVETDVYTRIPISGFTIRSNFHMHMHLAIETTRASSLCMQEANL